MNVRTDILPDSLTEEQRVVVQRIMEPYVADLPKIRDVVLPFGARMRQPKPAKDVDDLPVLVQQVVLDRQNIENIDPQLRMKIVEDFPPGEITTEIISYGLQSRQPATLSQGPPNSGRVRELKPHIRSIEHDPTQVGSVVITQGQQFENEVVFTCWAKTNKAANKRARWFEDTMKEYAWFIKYHGIMELVFLRQLEDTTRGLDGTDNVLQGRPLVYYVRTERLTHVLEPTIRRVVVEYRLGTEGID